MQFPFPFPVISGNNNVLFPFPKCGNGISIPVPKNWDWNFPVPIPNSWEWNFSFPFPFPNHQKSFPLTPVLMMQLLWRLSVFNVSGVQWPPCVGSVCSRKPNWQGIPFLPHGDDHEQVHFPISHLPTRWEYVIWRVEIRQLYIYISHFKVENVLFQIMWIDCKRSCTACNCLFSSVFENVALKLFTSKVKLLT